MTQQVPPENLISQKGWVKVGFNTGIWIPCPPAFPAGMDRESWAAEYARAWWETSGKQHGKREVSLLARSLAAIHQNVYGVLPCHLALIHLPDPRQPPLLVCLGIWPSLGERDSQLAALTHADEPAAMQPPIVTEFSTEDLGPGLKVLYYQLGKDGSTVHGCLNYAWRSAEHETDVRLFTSCPDLGRLQGAMPDIDDLARVITVVPRIG